MKVWGYQWEIGSGTCAEWNGNGLELLVVSAFPECLSPENLENCVCSPLLTLLSRAHRALDRL